MANYQFVVDSSFSPFTFQEMWQPALLYKQEAEKMQDKYDEIQDKADKFKYLSQTLPEGSEARKMYEGYADSLSRQADGMMQHGYNLDTWAGMRDLRRRYQGEIGQLEIADTRKKAMEEEQRKALLQNPTLLFDNDARSKSIDDYLHNPNLSYTPYSGALITQRVSQAASALARGVQSIRDNGRLDEYTKTYLKQSGVTPEQVQAAIDNPNDESVLNSILEGVIDSTGIKDWNNPATLKAAYAYGREGLYSAVGQTQATTYEDYGARLEAQKNKELEIARTKGVLENPTNSGDDDFNPVPLRGQQEISENNKKINDYSKYFTKKNGQYVLNNAGWAAYKTPVYVQSGPGQQGTYAQSTFKDFVDNELKAGKYIIKNKPQPGNIGNAYAQYIKNNQADSYDTFHTTQYYRKITGDESTVWTDQVKGASRKQDGTIILQPVDFDSKKREFTPIGDAIEGEDTKDFKVIGRYTSKYGTVVLMSDGSKTIQVKANIGNINYTAKKQAEANFAEADLWGEAADAKYRPKIDEDGKIMTDTKGKIIYTEDLMTEADRAVCRQNQKEAINIADYSEFNSMRVSKNKSDEIPKMW